MRSYIILAPKRPARHRSSNIKVSFYKYTVVAKSIIRIIRIILFLRDCSFCKLIIKIEGETAISHGLYSSHFNHQRRGYIYIKGKYTICDGKISSIVKNEGVETYAVESQDYHWKTETPPSESVSEISREESYGMARSRILRKRLLDYRFLWDWDEETFSVTGKELKIGERLVCER